MSPVLGGMGRPWGSSGSGESLSAWWVGSAISQTPVAAEGEQVARTGVPVGEVTSDQDDDAALHVAFDQGRKPIAASRSHADTRAIPTAGASSASRSWAAPARTVEHSAVCVLEMAASHGDKVDPHESGRSP
jgi:hypothetical protein